MTEATEATDATTQPVVAAADASVRKKFAILVGLAVLFVFLQSLTAGEFIADGLSEPVKEVWKTAHGLIAYPLMLSSLAAAILAWSRLRTIRPLWIMTGALFVSSVVQWLLGHAISNLGMDWVTPFHVVLAFVVYGLAIWLSIRSASLNRVK